jgi:hypothetical protein
MYVKIKYQNFAKINNKNNLLKEREIMAKNFIFYLKLRSSWLFFFRTHKKSIKITRKKNSELSHLIIKTIHKKKKLK